MPTSAGRSGASPCARGHGCTGRRSVTWTGRAACRSRVLPHSPGLELRAHRSVQGPAHVQAVAHGADRLTGGPDLRLPDLRVELRVRRCQDRGLLADVHGPVRRQERPGEPDLEPGLCTDLSLIHISEPTRLGMISYAVFCLKKK